MVRVLKFFGAPQKIYTPGVVPDGLGERFDLEGLPLELLEQLHPVRNPVEQKIVDAILGLEGMATVNEIIVALWWRDNVIRDRATVSKRLHKMIRRNLIAKVPDRLGVYTLGPEAKC